MTHIIITGAAGRMGKALQEAAKKIPAIKIVGKIESGQKLEGDIAGGDVVIDFTFPQSTVAFARLCATHGKAMVIGTTGHEAAEREELLALSAHVPMVWSPNFSTGVNVLFWLTQKAAEVLGSDYDLEIVEMHHRLKKDAPSGTASTLAKILAEVRGHQLSAELRHGRAGMTGERTKSEIGMHSIRGGDVVGDHKVIFATTGERLELCHKASSRETFANGALRAAQWIIGKEPGVYDMAAVLGLS